MRDPRSTFVLLFALLLGGMLPGQKVHLANLWERPWQGWKQVTCQPRPAANAGTLLVTPAGEPSGLVTYRVGRQVGLDVWVVDVWCSLQPGERRTFDLGQFVDAEMAPPPLPADLADYFRGIPAIDGMPMSIDRLQVDGAGWLAHCIARVPGRRMFVADLWVKWYPGQGWCWAEAMVTCSNPAVPDVGEDTGASPIRIAFGDAVPMVLGQPIPGVLVPAGQHFADGQARAVPLTFVWMRHLRTTDDGNAAITAWNYGVGGIGSVKPAFDGLPRAPAGFNPVQWAGQQMKETLLRLHDWRVQTTGFNPRSGDTGAQTGDQGVVGAECFPESGANVAGCELVRYFGAMKAAARPCQHREANGSPLDPSTHASPFLVLWDGRPHSHQNGQGVYDVSPDQLGKERPLNFDSGETSGWWGPDVEHDFHNTLSVACRITGSPMLQHLLRAQSVVYRLQQTTSPPLPPQWSTNDSFASRAQGYEGIRATQYWLDLEDRSEAQRARDHYVRRWQTKLRLAAAEPFYRDGFYPTRMSPWQAMVMVYGQDLAGRVFDIPEARQLALVQARTLVEKDFYSVAGEWRCYSTLALPSGAPDPAILDAQGNPLPGTNIFFLFGTPMGVWVACQEPGNTRAAAIWAQMLQGATAPYQAAWLPPGHR